MFRILVKKIWEKGILNLGKPEKNEKPFRAMRMRMAMAVYGLLINSNDDDDSNADGKTWIA